MAVVRSFGNNSGMRLKQMGFCVDCAAANPIRVARSSPKLCTCNACQILADKSCMALTQSVSYTHMHQVAALVTTCRDKLL